MERSLVAGVNALFRAAESKLPAGRRLLFDPWARHLSERNPRVQLVRYGRFTHPRLRRMVAELQAAHCIRHRAIDELLLGALRSDGFRQVVLIGAGYDMRRSRFREQIDGVRWIEIDHPRTQHRKWELLERLDDVDRRVDTVGADLMERSLEDALGFTGFDRRLPTLFVLEGFVHYLTLDRLEAMLASMRKLAPVRRVIASYIRSDMYRSAPSLFVGLVQLLREVPHLHFSPSGFGALLERFGLVRYASWTSAEQVERFAPEGRGRLVRLSQDIAVAEAVEQR